MNPKRDEQARGGWGRRRAVPAVLMLILVGGAVAGGVMWGEQRAASKIGRPPDNDGSRNASPGGGNTMPAMPGMPAASSKEAASADATEVTLSPDAVQRAGIKIDVVRSQAVSSALTVPGTVTSNAYRETKVNTLVGGVAG